MTLLERALDCPATLNSSLELGLKSNKLVYLSKRTKMTLPMKCVEPGFMTLLERAINCPATLNPSLNLHNKSHVRLSWYIIFPS